MGHIKEPKGIDFVVDPTPLTAEDRKMISKIIVHYKVTGQKKMIQKAKVRTHSVNTSNKRAQ